MHRREELRAGAILQKRAKENPKISFVWNSVVKAIKGKDGMQSVQLMNVKTGKESDLACRWNIHLHRTCSEYAIICGTVGTLPGWLYDYRYENADECSRCICSR